MLWTLRGRFELPRDCSHKISNLAPSQTRLPQQKNCPTMLALSGLSISCSIHNLSPFPYRWIGI